MASVVGFMGGTISSQSGGVGGILPKNSGPDTSILSTVPAAAAVMCVGRGAAGLLQAACCMQADAMTAAAMTGPAARGPTTAAVAMAMAVPGSVL